jgi:hypothetical protein
LLRAILQQIRNRPKASPSQSYPHLRLNVSRRPAALRRI